MLTCASIFYGIHSEKEQVPSKLSHLHKGMLEQVEDAKLNIRTSEIEVGDPKAGLSKQF